MEAIVFSDHVICHSRACHIASAFVQTELAKRSGCREKQSPLTVMQVLHKAALLRVHHARTMASNYCTVRSTSVTVGRNELCADIGTSRRFSLFSICFDQGSEVQYTQRKNVNDPNVRYLKIVSYIDVIGP